MELEDGLPSAPVPLFDSADDAQLASEVPAPAVAGSSQRGIILHKLMEEVLTGEILATAAELHRRAEELMAQLGLEPNSDPVAGVADSVALDAQSGIETIVDWKSDGTSLAGRQRGGRNRDASACRN